MADIPIKFQYFQKLKLFHDFLRKSRMQESTKKAYWLFEKSILLWAYSPDHQHIGRPLVFGEITTEEHNSKILSYSKSLSDDSSATNWVEKNIKNDVAIVHIISNLEVLGFVEEISRFQEGDISKLNLNPQFLDYVNKFRVSQKGFLLGELLSEKVNHPRKFWWMYSAIDRSLEIVFWIFIVCALVIAVGQATLVLHPKNSAQEIKSEYRQFQRHYK